MAKLILSIGFVFPGDFAEFVPLTSKRAVLDADLIVFRPGFSGFYFHADRYQGKRSLMSDSSFQFKEAASHWRQQLNLAIAASKNVIVFLPEYEQIWVDSGERTYSGTGKNRQTTRIVNPSSNYLMLPTFSESVVPSHGTAMKLTDKGNPILQSYWKEFAASSEYQVILEGLKVTPLLSTSAGDKPVSCHFTLGPGPGRIVALPTLKDYDDDPADLDVLSSTDHLEWDKTDKRFGQRLLTALLHIDDVIRQSGVATPPPSWVAEDIYALEKERELRTAILKAERQVEIATTKKAKLSEELAHEGQLRRLLFETGKPLESAILEALALLGFSAQQFQNADSEFDVVFVSAEGRFIGEAEGKDNKQVNIDKLRQLEMNIQEDLAREDVTEPAHGVLFGNACRLQPVAERSPDFFTEKCVKSAARTGTSLVRTIDLFFAARHAKESADSAFAAQCRRAILEQRGGVVQFPEVPVRTSQDQAEAAV